MGGRHTDIGDDDVGPQPQGLAHEGFTVPHSPDDLVSAVGQDEGQSLAQKDGVISDQNAHGIIASTVVGPPVGDVIVSLPSTPLRRSTRPARP